MTDKSQDDIDVLPAPLPSIRHMTKEDILGALKAGVKDFMRAPLYGLFFGGFFAIGGFFLLYMLASYKQPWWIMPMAFGFPIIGPFAAVGLYEVSRRLRGNETLSWGGVLSAAVNERKRQLPTMAFIVMFVFWIWMYQVRTLVALFAGLNPFSTVQSFTDFLFASTNGYAFLAVGTTVGAFMSLALYSITVISIPLLLDREIDFMSAIIVSIKTVLESPVVMLSWGIVVTFLALFGMATGFLGLLIVFPILGHATWHLYERAVLR
ncbi:MAG: DUF2189 domain-containing protein [Pseudomonadota bacterium]